MAARVGALAAGFLWRIGPILAPEGWDVVTVVPSTSGRPGAHPLEAALSRSAWLAPQLWPGLLKAGDGATSCGHRRAGDAVFRVAEDVRLDGVRVLVMDDTWTTGARAQSAASTLAGAGAEVVGLAVLGRVMTPLPGAPTGDWWARYASRAA